MRQTITVPVLSRDDNDRKFIVSYNDRKYRVRQLPYFYDREMPETLDCICEDRHDEQGLWIAIDCGKLMRKLYKEGDKIVCSLKYDCPTYYDLRTKDGFTARLDKGDGARLTARCLCCRVEHIGNIYMTVSFVEVVTDEALRLPFTPADLVEWMQAGTAAEAEAFVNLCGIFSDSWEGNHFMDDCHRWLSDYLSLESEKSAKERLCDLRCKLLALVESGRVFGRCMLTARENLEQCFTELISIADCWIEAGRLADSEEEENFVNRVLLSLHEAGFAFRPMRTLTILRLIARRNPLLWELHIGMVVKAIRNQKMEVWQRQPYAATWLNLLGSYINHVYPQTERLSTQPATRNLLVSALAAELTMAVATKSDAVDFALHKAILLRLCAEMNVCDADKMLEYALATLFDPERVPALVTMPTDDAVYIANILANSGNLPDGLPDEEMQYDNGRLTLCVGNGGIALQASNRPRTMDSVSALKKAKLWHGLDVWMDGKLSVGVRSLNLDKVENCKLVWKDIENYLFAKKPAPKIKKPKLLVRDEEVTIIVEGLKGDPKDMVFNCRIVDNDVEGRGTLDGSTEIAGYIQKDKSKWMLDYNTFRDDATGKLFKLPALIKDINEDGSYQFSMKSIVEEFAQDFVTDTSFEERIVCRVNNKPKGKAIRYPGISINGLSMSIGMPSGFDESELGISRQAYVKNISWGTNGYVNAEYDGPVGEYEAKPFNPLHELMKYCSYEDLYEEHAHDEPAEEEPVQVETLRAEHVVEFLHILNAKAELEEDYARGYHYLNFCALLARMLGLTHQEEYYRKRMRLVELMSYFDTNDQIDEKELQGLDEGGAFDNNQKLRRSFMQLRIISYLNKDEFNGFLARCSEDRSDEELAKLASLVLSHNYVKKAGLLQQANDIHEKIRAQLQLHTHDSSKKYYGREDNLHEFKTSIVFPPDSMQPNIEQQTKTILRVLCGMLNKEGGVLYLGVNNSGVEQGVSEDLRYVKFNGDQDKYDLHLHNNVVFHLGQLADSLIKTEWDNGTQSPVLVVTVAPSPRPIQLEGNYYERMGTSSREVNDDYLPMFLGKEGRWTQPEPVKVEPAEPVIEQISPTPNVIPIHTATTRNNVLDDYEDNYIQSAAYLTFLGSHDFRVSDQRDWSPCRLQLNIHEDERDGWLVMVYESGNVVRVPVEELLKRKRNQTGKCGTSEKLIFATIMGPADQLLLVLSNKKGQQFYRLNLPEDMKEGSMQSKGAPLTDLTIESVDYADLLPAENTLGSVPTRQSSKSYGTAISATSKDARKVIEYFHGCQWK